MSTNHNENRNIEQNNTRTISLQKGKIKPHATDLERAVLGGLMIDENALDKVIDILSVDAFYDNRHQKIFEAVVKLFEESKPVDLLSVSDQLRTLDTLKKAGGDYYLVELTQTVASAAHIEHYARIIIQQFIKRRLIEIAGEISTESYKDTVDVFDLLDSVESKIFDISQGNTKKGAEKASDLVLQAIEKIELRSKQKGVSGLATGFKKLDALTSGWQPSDLIILAARPGMGKTAFVLSMSLNIAVKSQKAVAIFSLEMSSIQLMMRMISSQTGLDSNHLRSGNLEQYQWDLLNTRADSLRKAPIFIDDTPSISIFDVRAKARRLKSQQNIQVIIIDYLQLMTAGANNKAGNREQEISAISRNLKALAKELEIPVIALSQLNRSVETRGGSKRPLLSDLRESGAIEQDADIVSFLYRPEYYGMVEWDDDEKSPCEGQAELIIAKHRNGNTGNLRIQFVGKYSKFSDLDTAETGTYDSQHDESNLTQEPILESDSSQTSEENNGVPF